MSPHPRNRRNSSSHDDRERREAGYRPIRRIRQACLNCRRKKARCSGDRPVCSFCSRLKQACSYTEDNEGRTALSPGPSSAIEGPAEFSLADRMGMVERRLFELSENQALSSLPTLLDMLDRRASFSTVQAAPENTSMIVEDPWADFLFSDVNPNSPPRVSNRSWAELPPLEVIQAATDVYFSHCYNQPYCYFHEPTFRQKLEDGSHSPALLFAFLATALRFSTDPYFDGFQMEAAAAYANQSWKVIISSQFEEEEGLNIDIVKSCNLLAIIDCTAGKLRLGWLKIGLSVRIAQDRGLMREPDMSLPNIEQEELRRVFWSAYLLDKLVSCGRARPPAISDEDCHVQLPSGEEAFLAGEWSSTRTLSEVSNTQYKMTEKPSQFSLVIWAASVLGRCARYTLHQRTGKNEPPWDPRSGFADISSSLLSLETYAVIGDDFSSVIRRDYTRDGVVDQSEVGHFVYWQALFHLTHCLLQHPFLLSLQVQNPAWHSPASFLTRSFNTCREHASSLSALLRDSADAGCFIEASFYGYCLTVSGSIHTLNSYSGSELVRNEAISNLESGLEMLDQLSKLWDHAGEMALQLRNFRTTAFNCTQLLATSQKARLEPSVTAAIWPLVDYVTLCQSAKSSRSARAPSKIWRPSACFDTGHLVGDLIDWNNPLSDEGQSSAGNMNPKEPESFIFSSEQFGSSPNVVEIEDSLRRDSGMLLGDEMITL